MLPWIDASKQTKAVRALPLLSCLLIFATALCLAMFW